ncbi:MAG: SUMF1/EgtB/PvdO family nonheme iron enzyme [Nitrospira sp.]
MSDIFISYASEDKSRVQALAQALERKGWSVWWDRRIPIGRSFDEVIEEALDGSKSVVVVWTTTSVKSQWVKNEAREGLRRRVLFPVMLVEEVRIPLEFRDVQTAHLMDWQPWREHAGFEQFLDDLIDVIGAPAVKSQVPPASSIKQTPETGIEPVQSMASVSLSENSNLLALTLSPGALAPAFAASTMDYTVNVASDETSVNISMTKADPDAMLSGIVTVGSGTATGQATLLLNGPGTVTPAVFTVTAPNGNSKTYRIMVNRAALSGNNNLSVLTISPGSLSPAFNTSTLNYTVEVASTVASMTVTPKSQDAGAEMTVNGQVTEPGQARTIVLSGPGSSTLINIVVTAPNGTQKTYMLHVSRAALSGNNNLQSVSISPGTLAPSFSANGTAYVVNVGNSVTSVTITPRLQDDNSSITINGQGTHSGQGRVIRLGPAGTGTEIEITVIAANGSEKTYRITISRAAFPLAVEVEPEAEKTEQRPSGAVTGSTGPYSSMESVSSTEMTDVSRGDQELVQVSEDRSSESTGTGQSSDSFPYLPIGLGLLVVVGALVYFLIFSQSPSSGPGEVAQYQSPVRSSTTRSEAVTPPPVPEPKQPAATATQEKPAVKQGTGLAKTITGKDGAPMVLVPAGDFIMGSREEEKIASKDEQPAHQVYLDAYYIDQNEVTTAQYAKFFMTTNRSQPEYWSTNVMREHGSKPVVGVDWNDVTAYCAWAGKRLPTEAEWEKAARGIDQRLYPWGNMAPSMQRANFRHCCNFKNYGVLTDVGLFEQGKSPYNTYDMAGNVWEWVSDWYEATYYGESPNRNPKGPLRAQARVVRGGSWTDAPVSMRSAYRLNTIPSERSDYIGFRCAQDVSN